MRSDRSHHARTDCGTRGLCALLSVAVLLALAPVRVHAQEVVVQTAPPDAPSPYVQTQTEGVYTQTQPAGDAQVVYAQPGYGQSTYVQPVAAQPVRERRDAGPRVALIVSGAVMLGLR